MPTLEAIGYALYGKGWMTTMAVHLKISDRTIRRWVVGETPVPPWVWHRLRDLLVRQATVCSTMASGMDIT